MIQMTDFKYKLNININNNKKKKKNCKDLDFTRCVCSLRCLRYIYMFFTEGYHRTLFLFA